MELTTDPFTITFETNLQGVKDLGQSLTTMIRHELASHYIGEEPQWIDLEHVEVERIGDHGQGVFEIQAEVELNLPKD